MKKILFALALITSIQGISQDGLTYQVPPKEIMELVDVERTPYPIFNKDRSIMVTLQRDAFNSIEEMSRTEIRIGGLRIDPVTNIGSRTNYYNKLQVKDMGRTDNPLRKVTGIPKNAKLANIVWSPDENYVAMTNTTKTGVELWILDIKTVELKKISKPSKIY